MPTKKAAVATIPKKVAAAPKKAVVKTNGKSLVYATNEHSFWTSSGAILNSLTALRDALKGMDKSVFTHHVSGAKNDFADWVEAVLNDAACATDLRKAKTAASAHTVVVRHLKSYRL